MKKFKSIVPSIWASVCVWFIIDIIRSDRDTLGKFIGSAIILAIYFTPWLIGLIARRIAVKRNTRILK